MTTEQLGRGYDPPRTLWNLRNGGKIDALTSVFVPTLKLSTRVSQVLFCSLAVRMAFDGDFSEDFLEDYTDEILLELDRLEEGENRGASSISEAISRQTPVRENVGETSSLLLLGPVSQGAVRGVTVRGSGTNGASTSGSASSSVHGEGVSRVDASASASVDGVSGVDAENRQPEESMDMPTASAEESGVQPQHGDGRATDSGEESDVEVSVVRRGGGDDSDTDEDLDDDYNVPLIHIQRDWSPISEHNRHTNIQPFQEDVGPTHTLPENASVLDYFFLFIPLHFFYTLARETNRYARQKQEQAGRLDKLWYETTADEMRAFVSILIIMGINGRPQLWMYWSTDDIYSNPWVSATMSRNRFMKLNQYFHLRDTSAAPGRDEPGYDPLFKLRTFIDMLLPLFRDNFNLGRDLSVDEAMIGFKGRLFFKQYLPMKPIKWGVKMWMLCDSETGYCKSFDIYTGKSGRRDRTIPLGFEVVDLLVSPYYNRRHHVYFDRFFTSVGLMAHLALNGTYASATVKSNRVGLPPQVINAELEKGQIKQMKRGMIMATAYKDNKRLYLLSTNAQPGMVTRADGKEIPAVVSGYNKYMGGVDKSDQHRSYYAVGHKTIKWWRCIFQSLLNLAIIQAWVIWSKSPHNPPRKKTFDHLQFRGNICHELRNGFTSRKVRAGRKRTAENPAPVPKAKVDDHVSVRIETRRRECRHCINTKHTKPNSKRYPESQFECNKCKVALCVNKRACFFLYHGANPPAQEQAQ